ncbi:hypothetical protein cyc_04267 [Cyclospora cayetanensis]|uniref:Uncharacterized protein n=1 Tax=Cyclospora cayetanensis TaxID=88456 RepID=A0A1D3D0S3_9EIME|nr:hypothetical protein cyc_04267 [Cyclospora cayetanensis]
MLGKRGHLVILEREHKRLATLLGRLQTEGGLRGPYLSPCCSERHAAKIPSPRGSQPGKGYCDREGSATSTASKVKLLQLARLAAKRPLYFTRACEAPRNTDAGASAAASYPALAAVLPLLLVEVRAADFSTIDGRVPPFCFAQKIILDPSCSGSGLPTHKSALPLAPASTDDGCAAENIDIRTLKHHLDPPDLLQCSWEGWSRSHLENPPAGCPQGPLPSILPPAAEEDRVVRLAALQHKLLSHALTAFPSASLVCYSTCSLYVHENEAVLLRACLQQQQQQQPSPARWRVCQPPLHSGWFPLPSAIEELRYQVASCGHSTESGGKSPTAILDEALCSFGTLCVRAFPQIHKCRGFFLATLQRDRPPHAQAVPPVEAAAFTGYKGPRKRKNPNKKEALSLSIAEKGGSTARKKPKLRSCTKAGIRI